MIQNISLETNEKIIFGLRELYDSYGYSRYKMSKFEEYDLYSENKDFLISDGVITFTDTNGKLMALKPDVTLSIVRNTSDVFPAVQKLYYNENVYRVSKSTHSFKEIMQVGLECIGNVDNYCIYEVLKLALESLKSISENCILDISSLDIIVQTIKSAGIPENETKEILHYIGEKNQHQLAEKCNLLGIEPKEIDTLKKLISLSGTPEKVLPELEVLLRGRVNADVLEKFKNIVSEFADEKCINIDFSLVDDVSYYNGIVFKGFTEGVPTGVLSGGQYDTLMKKMNREAGAIGFAVYLDMLERFNVRENEFDVDTVLVYGDGSTASEIAAKTGELRKDGSVLAVRSLPEDIRCRRTVILENGEVKTVENNA